MITETGDGLVVVIECKQIASNDWMAFACWYSFNKTLPDAEVMISVQKGKINRQIFLWPSKVGVRFYNEEISDKRLIFVDCAVMAIREMNDSFLSVLNNSFGNEIPGELICEAKEEIYVPFVRYRGGCGNFFMSEWIDIVDCPFPLVDKFMIHSASSNEIRILKLWKQLSQAYATVSKGW